MIAIQKSPLGIAHQAGVVVVSLIRWVGMLTEGDVKIFLTSLVRLYVLGVSSPYQ
jgi:hypothetical protein